VTNTKRTTATMLASQIAPINITNSLNFIGSHDFFAELFFERLINGVLRAADGGNRTRKKAPHFFLRGPALAKNHKGERPLRAAFFICSM
jgi:hypothetical protein